MEGREGGRLDWVLCVGIGLFGAVVMHARPGRLAPGARAREGAVPISLGPLAIGHAPPSHGPLTPFSLNLAHFLLALNTLLVVHNSPKHRHRARHSLHAHTDGIAEDTQT